MFLFHGLCPPLVTAFDSSGKLDQPRMRQHVDFMIAGAAGGLAPAAPPANSPPLHGTNGKNCCGSSRTRLRAAFP